MQNFLTIVLAAAFLTFTACSDDSRRPSVNGSAASAVSNPTADAPAVPAPPAPPATAAATVSWVSDSHDFGQIPKGIPASHNFEFTNTGTESIKIARVKASCGCTATDYSKEEIQPGETGYVQSTFNAAAEGPFKKSVTVTFEGARPLQLNLQGEVAAN
ncbi:MAG: DUF1573 domain-containing protein [Bacteroidota bacterium]